MMTFAALLSLLIVVLIALLGEEQLAVGTVEVRK